MKKKKNRTITFDFELEAFVINELAEFGFEKLEQLEEKWYWCEKQAEFKGKNYLISGHVRLLKNFNQIQICDQVCLLQQ